MLIPISSCNQPCRMISKNIECYSIYCCIFFCIKFYTIAVCTIYCMISILNSSSFSIICTIWWYQYTCIITSIAFWIITNYSWNFFTRSYINTNTAIYRIPWSSYFKGIMLNSSVSTITFCYPDTYVITTINIKCSSIYGISTTGIS